MSDVYCFGHITTGVILRLRNAYPAADGYAEIAETLENHAGEATAAALVLAQLGASVTLEGNWIGDTPACRRTLEFLRTRGIDCAGLVVKTGYAGVNEIVVSDRHTRTVFGRFGDLLATTRQWEMPDAARIRAARIACVDPSFGEATLLVARTAKAAGIPVVTSDAAPDSPLAALADILVISGEFLARDHRDCLDFGPARDRLFDDYLARCPGLVVFTAGSRPLWFARAGEATRHEFAPFSVEVIDSAGAGDSLRAGLIYGLLQGWTDAESVRFASAVAALICTTAPGCVHPPTLAQVRSFLDARGESPA
ncbi:MAG TPA: carbohydrate kinase family protein [Opitutus sp.]|nr:carbohydrate kinase family protein [Opitutus sp.]